jgi:hypothetical protein
LKKEHKIVNDDKEKMEKADKEKTNEITNLK